MGTTLITTIAAVLAVLLVVGGGVGVWLAVRTGQSGQTVKNYQEAAASWREKADSLEAEVAGLRHDLKILRGLYETLSVAHEALKSVVTGTDAIEALGVQIETAKLAIIREIQQNRSAVRGGSQ